jgi:hypothetical protein
VCIVQMVALPVVPVPTVLSPQRTDARHPLGLTGFVIALQSPWRGRCAGTIKRSESDYEVSCSSRTAADYTLCAPLKLLGTSGAGRGGAHRRGVQGNVGEPSDPRRALARGPPSSCVDRRRGGWRKTAHG